MSSSSSAITSSLTCFNPSLISWDRARFILMASSSHQIRPRLREDSIDNQIRRSCRGLLHHLHRSLNLERFGRGSICIRVRVPITLGTRMAWRCSSRLLLLHFDFFFHFQSFFLIPLKFQDNIRRIKDLTCFLLLFLSFLRHWRRWSINPPPNGLLPWTQEVSHLARKL